MPNDFIDSIWDHFDHGTQRAILKLYRSAPPDVLARAGERLSEINAPTLVLWGAEDSYLPTRFAHAYGEVLGGEVEIVDGAGHWPWIDRPQLVERVCAFLS
jgi:pimeloyl-ACP methyl ester carboxylesterase